MSLRNRLFRFLLVAALAVSTMGFNPVSAQEINQAVTLEKPEQVTFDESIPQDAVLQQPALDAYQKLMSSPGFSESAYGDEYPDDFGGYYIGTDNQLHVQCLNGAENNYKVLFDSDEPVVFETVVYPYNELKALADQIIQNDSGVLTSGVDEQSNQVLVEVSENSQALSGNILDLVETYGSKSLLDTMLSDRNAQNAQHSPLSVRIAEPVVTMSELWAGDEISGNSHTYTLGSTGYYQGSQAIVT
ncbi:MAG: hypothetical protein PHP39_05715 [Oscillospiraceae bacterium]|nr:hypothetical protein [Oscillospiraceae bacterium]